MVKDYVRHYIQVTSKPTRTTRFTHTGWREIGGEWAYLTAAGAIGRPNTIIKLPKELERYSLPSKPESEIEAIETSLSFLDVGDKSVTLPLFAFTYLSPMTALLKPMPNFVGYLYGDTGTLKTTIAVTGGLSHFGSFDTVAGLSNFEDTANALTRRVFTLKDILMVIDDYHPSTNRQDAHKKEAIAQRLIRAYSNRTDRHRLNSDSTEKGAYEPRGMLLVTGEELISLQSTLARTMVIEVEKGNINTGRLSELQGKTALLPHAMASYIIWIKKNMESIKQTFPEKFKQLRNKACGEASHRKLPEQVAFMQFALESALSWACEKTAIDETQAKDISSEGWEIFMKLADTQAQRLTQEDPVNKFKDILTTLLAQGKVKLEAKILDSNVLGGHDGELLG